MRSFCIAQSTNPQFIAKAPLKVPFLTRRICERRGTRPCSVAGLGKLEEVEGRPDPRYTELIIHDLRRSAIKNLMNVGVNEKVAMKISGHKTRDVFDRYHIIDTEDVVDAMRRVQTVSSAANSLMSNGEKIKIVKMLPSPRRKVR
jgi:hypothetical protein